ncbi:signal peptidase II [Paraferrimonas sp. SM1919]|uniref:signal peptidase II n=1 Tax=Paraferrimonas sp. SM1919 TaxID=2662263 RepID=UPI0013D5617D|nr:signal peptidase II [Paraferrimonas sp. SM1919]
MNTDSWKSSGLTWLWVSALVIISDQITKLWVLNSFALYEFKEILPVFNLTYVRNYGAAFSFLSDAGGWQKYFFSIIAVGVSLLLCYWLRKQHKSQWHLNLSYTLVIGGAIGNLIDRLEHGFVVDFLDFHWGVHHFPAFNVADMAICAGAGLLILDAFLHPESKQDKK